VPAGKHLQRIDPKNLPTSTSISHIPATPLCKKCLHRIYHFLAHPHLLRSVGVGNNNFLVLVSKQGPCFPHQKAPLPRRPGASSPCFPCSFTCFPVLLRILALVVHHRHHHLHHLQRFLEITLTILSHGLRVVNLFMTSVKDLTLQNDAAKMGGLDVPSTGRKHGKSQSSFVSDPRGIELGTCVAAVSVMPSSTRFQRVLN
jgi:hypothetical protein